MNAVLGILSKKWVISLIGVIALSLVVWFAGPYIGIADVKPLASPVVRLLVILVLFLLWGLNNLRHQLTANRENDRLLDELGGPAGPDPAVDAAQSAEELQVLRERFTQAMAVLKKAKLSGRGGEARLYELPWYIIIGPPGSGKTTALANSELRFPLADQFGAAAVKGVGGTRNCDWWFTNEAVLLDTAGRYAIQDSHQAADAAAWNGFLDLLRKYRRRRPINGVIVTISLSDLMQQTEYERDLNAQAIRRRVQELTEKFGISFPIYLMLSKCDLVAGFIECFDDLGRDERAQVWGTTFPLEASAGAESLADTFGPAFDGLMARLNQRILWRLHQERDVNRRNLILGFPHRMASLKPILTDFIAKVFQPSRYENRALLRGVYFTSGTQEGTPIDRLMGSLSRAFGVDPQAAVTYGGPGKSFFLTRLFSEVIFPEAEITGTSRAAERRSNIIAYATYAAAIVVTVGAALGFAIGFTRNDASIEALDQRIDAFTRESAAVARTDLDISRKLPALAALRQVSDVFADRADHLPLVSDMGLYVGAGLGEEADAAYGRVVEQALLPHIMRSLEDRMRDGSRGVGPVYNALTVYLSLADPAKMDRARLRDWMRRFWSERYSRNAVVRDQLTAHLDFMLAREVATRPQLNGFQITTAQRIVCQASPDEQILRRIYERIDAAGVAAFELASVSRTARRVFVPASGKASLPVISGRFTREGYDAFVRDGLPEIPRMYEQISSVCGLRTQMTESGLADLRRRVEDRYSGEYVQHWDRLVSEIRLVGFTDIAHATQVLEALAGTESPLRDLLMSVERHTALGPAPVAGAKTAGPAGAAPPQPSASAVRRRFGPLHVMVRPAGDKPPPLEALLGDVAALRDYMAALANAPDRGIAAIDAAKRRFQNQGRDLIGRVRDEAGRHADPIRQVLQAAARNSWAAVLAQSRAHLNTAWKEEVLPAYQRLRDRYPLAPSSKLDARLVDFARFFRPNGVLDEFVKANLAPFVRTRGRWRLHSADGMTIGIPGDTLEQFRRAERIMTALFPDGAESPTVRFSIEPLSLDSRAGRFTLTMDGQTIEYRHTPVRPLTMTWPGPKRPGHVRMVFADRYNRLHPQRVEGDWAWFRILAPERLERTRSSDRLRARFELDGFTAVYQITTDSLTNPFSLAAELFRFRAPQGL